jgi:site-specific DNA-methyltransferase (adenine-specific)
MVKQGRLNNFQYRGVAPQIKIHPTERPIEMMEDLLSVFCKPGDLVLVPFLGSGNTILACYNLGLSGVGFDLSQNYKDSFTLRVYGGGPYKSYKVG